MDLSSVHQGVARRKLKKRVGRGPGSGHGKTASRGSKGQYASAGAKMFSWTFEGGSYRLSRGTYQWRVWPGIGAPSAHRYRPLLGHSTFVVP